MQKILLTGFILLSLQQFVYTQVDSLKYGLKGKIIRALGQSSDDPLIYYAGLKGNNLGTGYIYKSEDFGKTWHVTNNEKPIDPYVADIQAIEVANDATKTIYAGTWKNGLFKSSDQGKSWIKDLRFPSSDIRSIKSGTQTPLLVYAATSNFGVVKSTDGGKSWKRNSPETIDNTFKFAWSIEIDKNNDNIIFAQTYNNGIWQSIDQGETWSQVLDTEGKVSWDMKISPNSKDIWVASSKSRDTLSSVYYSNDGGNDWTEINDVPQVGVNQINVIERDNKKTIIIGSWQDGIYIYADDKWIKNDLVDFDSISEILINNKEVLIGSWGNGIYKLKL